MTTPTHPHDLLPQVDQPPPDIRLWRRRRLLEAGFPPALADEVADERRFDLHALLELVDRGCPPVLAVRILAPAEPLGAQ